MFISLYGYFKINVFFSSSAYIGNQISLSAISAQ